MAGLSFTVPGKPRGQGRPRFGNGRAYKAGEDVTYEAVIAGEAIRAAEAEGLALPVIPAGGRGFSVMVVIWHAVPKSLTKARRAEIKAGIREPLAKPDIDNVLKALFDALSGVVWADDSAVTGVTAVKRYSSEPGLEVTVSWRGV